MRPATAVKSRVVVRPKIDDGTAPAARNAGSGREPRVARSPRMLDPGRDLRRLLDPDGPRARATNGSNRGAGPGSNGTSGRAGATGEEQLQETARPKRVGGAEHCGPDATRGSLIPIKQAFTESAEKDLLQGVISYIQGLLR